MKLGKYAPRFFDRLSAAAKQSRGTLDRLDTVSEFYADILYQQTNEALGPREMNFINIGGGTAIDSINGMLKWRKKVTNPAVLGKVTITVFDYDVDGPDFGKRALTALMVEGAPLHDMNIEFKFVKYKWDEPEFLADYLKTNVPSTSLVIAGSEGALLEYPSDEVAVGNLKALRESLPAGFSFVGTLFRDSNQIDPLFFDVQAAVSMRWKLRGMDGDGKNAGLHNLASQSGFHIARVDEGSTFWLVTALEPDALQ